MGVLPFRLSRLACLQFWQGSWSAARATAHEALKMADDTGWVTDRPNSLAVLARVEAVTGRPEDARGHATRALAQAEQAGARPQVAASYVALGLMELSRGRYPAAIGHFEIVAELAQETGLADTPLVWWSSDLIEAYVHEGLTDLAQKTLRRLERSAASSSAVRTRRSIRPIRPRCCRARRGPAFDSGCPAIPLST